MKIRIDIKSLVAGLILGAVILLAMGQAYNANRSDLGFAVDYRGSAIITDSTGAAYVVDTQTGRAKIIEHQDGPYKGRAFNINRVDMPGQRN